MAVFMSALDGSIVIIALPAIFRGIHLDPLAPGNISYLLWMIMGYRLVQAVLVVTVGRLGDMYGRVKIYNSGFAVFTVASVLLSFDPFTGAHGAQWLIGWRVVQALGGSMLTANSAAILTDAFPADRRGFALGINQVAAIAGQFIGLVAGGVLAEIDWRAVFWVNVPVGVFGTVWAYHMLRDTGERHPGRIDWWGNITFAVGLSAILIGVTNGIKPYGGHAMGWTNPTVIGSIVGGAALLVAFVLIERRVAEPMFQLGLFKIRAFAAGSAAGLIAATARGGLQFMLVIWLQGIWLPLHGYSYTETPLWAGIYLLPLTTAFLISGPVCGYLSDRFGARGFATAGMLVFAASFVGLMFLPVNFPYWAFAGLIVLNGIGVGMFSAPELGVDHEQRPRPVPRRRLGDAVDLPEHRHRTVDRRVLLAPDRWHREQPPGPVARRSAAAGRAPRDRPSGRRPAAGLLAVRGHARRQPGGASPRADRRADLALPRPSADPYRHALLPAADRGRVPPRPRGRVQRRHRFVGARRGRVADARRSLRPHRCAPTPERNAT